MDVGFEGVDAALDQPVDQGHRRFRGDASALPRNADHPSDGGGCRTVTQDGRLHGSHRIAPVAQAHDPVQPRSVAIRRRPREQAPITFSQLVEREWTSTGVRMEARIPQDSDHLLGVVDTQWDQLEPSRMDVTSSQSYGGPAVWYLTGLPAMAVVVSAISSVTVPRRQK